MPTVPNAETGDAVQRHVDRSLSRLAAETLADMRLWLTVAAATLLIVGGLTFFAYHADAEEREAFNQALRWLNDIKFLADGIASAFKVLSEGTLNLAYAIAILQLSAVISFMVALIAYVVLFGLRASTVDETSEQIRRRIDAHLGDIAARGVTAQTSLSIPNMPNFVLRRLFHDPGQGARDAIERMAEAAAGDVMAMRRVEGFARDVRRYRTTGEYEALLKALSESGLEGAELLGLELSAFPQYGVQPPSSFPPQSEQKANFRTLALRAATLLTKGDAQYAMDPLRQALSHAHAYDERILAFVLTGYALWHRAGSGTATANANLAPAADAFQRALDIAAPISHNDPVWPRAVVDRLYLNAWLARLRLDSGDHEASLDHCAVLANAIRISDVEGAGEMAAATLPVLKTLRGHLNVRPAEFLALHAKTVLSILDTAKELKDFNVAGDTLSVAEFRARYDLALYARGRGEPKEALVDYRRAIKIGISLYGVSPSSAADAETMSGLFQSAAEAAQSAYEFWTAKEYFKAAIDVLAQHQAHSVRIATLYLSLGEAMSELQDPSGPEAVRTAQRMLAAAAKAGNTIEIKGKSGLWRSHLLLGQMAMRNPMANLAAAHLQFDAARKLAEGLVAAKQSDANALVLLSASRLGLGDCYLAGQRFRDAGDAFAAARRAAQQALDLRFNDDAAQALWEAELKSAEVALAVQQVEEADKLLQAANTSLGQLRADARRVPELLTLLRQGELYAARGLTSDALQCFRKCVEDSYAALETDNDPHVWPVMAEAADQLGATARAMRHHHLRERNQVDSMPGASRVLLNAYSEPPPTAHPSGAVSGGPGLHAIRGGKA